MQQRCFSKCGVATNVGIPRGAQADTLQVSRKHSEELARIRYGAMNIQTIKESVGPMVLQCVPKAASTQSQPSERKRK
jgi:hypothetical protein